jgi:AAA domain
LAATPVAHVAYVAHDARTTSPVGIPPEEHPAATPTHRLTTVTAHELMTRIFPPSHWVVPGFLPERLTLLAGKPKMGKSWLAFDLAIAVAGGGMALGHRSLDPGPVLYLALEDNERRLQQRLAQLLGTAPVPQRLDLATACERLDRGGEAQIGQWLQARPAARLVIVDTLAKVRPPTRPGGTLYEDDYGAVHGLKRLADRHGVAILLVHHLRKLSAADPLDEISGSTGLTGAVDGAIVLRRQRRKPSATLHVSGRDLEDREVALAWEATACRWTLVKDAAGPLRSPERAAILEVLRPLAPQALAPAEMARRLGKPPDAVRQLLLAMAHDREIVRESRGHYHYPLSAAHTASPASPACTDHRDHSQDVQDLQEGNAPDAASPA